MATALAHPNVALIKYWGKNANAEAPIGGPGENVPATPSLSIALAALTTRTQVRAAAHDEIRIDGAIVHDRKIERLVAALRTTWDLPPLAVSSGNDFPTSAGLASSASGFAALITAIDGEFRLGLSARQRSIWARRGSASAARSVAGGFATLAEHDGDWSATTIAPKEAWPLEVAIAVTSTAPKPTPSTVGMELSRTMSPFYPAWLQSTRVDFQTAVRAVAARDFETLASVAEHSCMKMHALMLSTRPSLLYWNEATLACIRTVKELQDAGTPVFFTIDAGPQFKAVCQAGAGAKVAAALAQVPGVLRVLRSEIGGAAQLQER